MTAEKRPGSTGSGREFSNFPAAGVVARRMRAMRSNVKELDPFITERPHATSATHSIALDVQSSDEIELAIRQLEQAHQAAIRNAYLEFRQLGSRN